ncbi:MAG: hypothetical protein CMJ62_03835 [Planctomycetaceae bacterium]|nr:hypothetical protein [Planctomycetaceae bacterium]
MKGLGVATFVRNLVGSLDIQGSFEDPRVDPAHPKFSGPAIFIFWHEYIPVPLYLRGHCHIAMLLSRHRDAEWLSVAAQYMGFETVRGSSKRGGGAALLELSRISKTMNLAITPDGPRGPRRVLAAGAIYLASKLGIPLVAMGFGYNRSWRLPTWDRFAVPFPHARARVVLSRHLYIPQQLDRQGVEAHRQRVEDLLTHLTQEAESWAKSGRRKTGQEMLAPRPAAWRKRQPGHEVMQDGEKTDQSHWKTTPKRRAG